MPTIDTLLYERRPLREICHVPDSIISVYNLDQHIWAGSDTASFQQARKQRIPCLQTIDEFQINPVRPFLNDIFRLMAAPYKPERRDQPIGQGYWIQAEFGSGKTHLLCFLAALALGDEKAWQLVRTKEEKAGRGRRESLYQFWEEGLREKGSNGKRGLFVITKTLVGASGNMVGISGGQRLIDYILQAARDQLYAELGKNISLYPVEILADRFLQEDLDLYREALRGFLHNSRYFAPDEFEDFNDFLNLLQSNKAPEYKRHCGDVLWRFYTEYLKVSPQVELDLEAVLKHMVETILAQGYSGVLVILDEVSIFMKSRSDDLRQDDEATLVTLSNRLTRSYNLPIWTVCSAQQAIESKMGVKNIIADDRLKQELLLKDSDDSYYDIILSRVREIIHPEDIGNYYLYYKKRFTGPGAIGEEQFRRFFPFHKPALEVVRAISAGLTTARSSIHFMHETLKRQQKLGGNELISLWHLFDEAVNYEEDPSGLSGGMMSIKTQYELQYNIYVAGRRQIEGYTKAPFKSPAYRDKAIKSLQTLLLYYLARTRQQGILPDELANSVLIPRRDEDDADTNTSHYLSIAHQLSKELTQVVETPDAEGDPRYRFEPTVTGINPRAEFQKARDDAEGDEKMQQAAWNFLLALTRGSWVARARTRSFNLSETVESIFAAIAPGAVAAGKEAPIEMMWQRRQVKGAIAMRDLALWGKENRSLPRLDTAVTDNDFALYVSMRPVSLELLTKLLRQQQDPRVLLWSPAELTYDERNLLCDLAAYRKLHELWNGRDSDEALEMIEWMSQALQGDLARIMKIVEGAYGRGRIEALEMQNLEFHMAGSLNTILSPVISRVLSAVYESRAIAFPGPADFRPEDAVKVINGIVRTGEIPYNAKPNKDISAVNNFALSLGIIKKGQEKKLNVSANRFVQDIAAFLDEKLGEADQTLSIDVLYRNFMGIGGPGNKHYGLMRRMVQLYLLCLVQEGKIRLQLGPKAGLTEASIDYATIKNVEFSTRILEAITGVQKIAKPRNWELFRPFARVLLQVELPKDYHDQEVARKRVALRELFAREHREAKRIADQSIKLCKDLELPHHPYAETLQRFARIFQSDLGVDEIDEILGRLDEIFGYHILQEERLEQSEIDDFTLRYQQYEHSRQLLNYTDDLRVAFIYSRLPLPQESDHLQETRELQAKLCHEIQNIKTYIDSEPLLRTRLLGQGPAEHHALLPELITSYADVYENIHSRVITQVERYRQEIHQLLDHDDLEGLATLEHISALQPAISLEIRNKLQQLAQSLFTCPAPSSASVREALQRETHHRCELTLQNWNERIQKAKDASNEAQHLFSEGINHKLQIFLNATIRERLQQGEGDPLVADLLACSTVEEVRTYLLHQCRENPVLLVDTISRYLKRIIVKKVSLTTFKASRALLEREHIAQVAREFQAFLERQITEVESSDILPILELE